MPSQEDKIKSLKINSKTTNKGKDIEAFMPLVQMIARKEAQSRSKQVMSYEEMVNTGLIAVNKLIESAKVTQNVEYNSSYIAQSVKWAIKDELRARQSWYGVKKVITVEEEEGVSPNPNSEIDPTETREIKSLDDARKAVFEVIMSVEGMEEETGFTPEDSNNPEILEKLELLSMKKSLQKSVSKLPENLRQVIELRFYKCLTGNEVAEALNVTPSRISHMIREAVNKLRVLMVAEGYNSL